MHIFFEMAATLTLATGGPAASQPANAPFATAAVSDAELASAAGTGGPNWRMSDEIAASAQRQTAAITATIKDLWLIDFVSPLIGVNVRAGSGF